MATIHVMHGPDKGRTYDLPVEEAIVGRQGEQIALLAFGSQLANARIVGDALNATVINMRFIKPLDTTLIKTLAGLLW